MVVEFVDAIVGDRLATRELELLLGVQFRREAVAIPAEAALSDLAAHGLVARNQILHEAGDEMTVMRQAIGEGRAIIEDELLGTLGPTAVDRLMKDVFGQPPSRDFLFHLGEGGRGIDGRVDWRLLRFGHYSDNVGAGVAAAGLRGDQARLRWRSDSGFQAAMPVSAAHSGAVETQSGTAGFFANPLADDAR